MIDLKGSDFFLPTKKFRELSILLAIMQESHVSQKAIAALANLSGAMVNGYVKKLKENKLIDIVDKNRRDKLYRLTDVGRKRLTESLINCSAEIVQLYVQAKQEIVNKLNTHIVPGKHSKVVMFGGADTAHLVISALEQFPHVVLSAVVDNDQLKWGENIGNHVIQSPDLLSKHTFDCLIISSFAKQEEIYESISWLEKSDVKIIKLTSL